MSREILQNIIEEFDTEKFARLFRAKNRNFAPKQEDLNQYDDDNFKNSLKLGDINFADVEQLVVLSFKVTQPLSERSGKKAQYEKAKKILKESGHYDAGIFIFYDDIGNFRFSLIYGQAVGTKRSFSNFKRFTYFVSKELTNTTFLKQIGDGGFSTLENTKEAFSVEAVNKEFYREIAKFFYQLIGGKVKVNTRSETFERELKLPIDDSNDNIFKEFAVRLIGRLVFCWFLKKKKPENGKPLIPEELLSSQAISDNYYHLVLEPLFFQTLNTLIENRNKDYPLGIMEDIPFLNGGLFEPHKDDYYRPNDITGISMNLKNVAIPDNWFKELFEVFERFNFTIDENTTVDVELSIDPEMLGRIFENLLAEINPETGETARKSTGSYYTPRPIVEYMVDESLKQYLITKSNIEEEKLAELLSYEEEAIELLETEKDAIIEALDKVKIIDPACGSGAFPMGILHKILLILQRIDPDNKRWLKKVLNKIGDSLIYKNLKIENPDYVRKLGIIRESIYGVDIQQIAVEISKLRFFLSLIVDETIDDSKPNRGVEHLPNLEFKFVAANSLIGLPEIETNKQFSIFEAHDEIERLKQLREEYFTSYGDDKKKVEEEFEEAQKSMFNHAVSQGINGNADSQTALLSQWNPFSDDHSDWFDPEWMFGINDGFDIVIGNPPYVEHKKLKYISTVLKKNYLTYSGTADLYVYFFENGIKNLKENGILVYITSNKFLKTSYGENLRKYFATFKINEIIDFTDVHVFEALVASCILSISKSNNSNNKVKVSFANDSLLNFADLTGFVDNNKFFLKQNTLSEKIWQLEDETNLALKEKIESGSLTMESTGTINVYRGVTTGYNPAFIIDEEKRNELIKEDKANKAIIKPLLQGRNIRKWFYNKTSDYLVFTRKGINIKEYPSIKKHLSNFKQELEPGVGRKAGSYNWFEIQDNTAYYPEFEKEKIIWGLTSDKWTFAYDNENKFLPSNGYILTSTEILIKYLLALLNSKLMEYYFGFIGIMTAGGAFTLKQETVSEFPIKNISLSEQKPFITIVDKILAITKSDDYLENSAKKEEVKEYEKQIDQMVYKLYALTPDEIEIAEGKTT